jgi:hypothetical protein
VFDLICLNSLKSCPNDFFVMSPSRLEVLPIWTKQDWSMFDGIYFAYMSVATIDIGEYNVNVVRDKGVVFAFLVIGISLFRIFIFTFCRFYYKYLILFHAKIFTPLLLIRLINVWMLIATRRNTDEVSCIFNLEEM